MAVNKVKLSSGETLIDISGDTVDPETLSKGVTAHDKTGTKITGAAPTASEVRGDNGFLNLSYIDVTIGANTVGFGGDALNYFEGLVNWRVCAVSLLSNPSTQNQLMMIPGAMTNPSYTSSTGSGRWVKFAYRYRDSACQNTMLNQDYAYKLVQGTKYRVWVCDLNTTNLKPY